MRADFLTVSSSLIWSVFYCMCTVHIIITTAWRIWLVSYLACTVARPCVLSVYSCFRLGLGATVQGTQAQAKSSVVRDPDVART
jgi:hypothetical protein